MKGNSTLVVSSLLCLILISLHIADDIARGISPAEFANMTAVVIFFVWLYATALLAERRTGHIIMLIGGFFSLGMPLLHLRGAKIRMIAEGDGGFFFIWTLLALGTLGLFTMAVATREIWNRRRPAP
jgi:hypothetical protein